MSLKAVLIKSHMKHIADRFELATLQPAKAQRQKLLSIVRKNKKTEYGKRYSFSSIRTVSDYQKHVPVVEYEDIRSEIERMVAGEKNIMTAQNPVMFARTSGTTGKPKYIPVTHTCRNREHLKFSRTWAYYAIHAYPEIMNGKIVSLVSPAIEGHTQSGIPFGSITGSIYRDMPSIVNRKYAIPYEVFEISDYQAKYYAILRIALEQDVSVICTANPSSILKMCEKTQEFSEQIIRDIRNGTLSKSFDIAFEIRLHLEKHFKSNPDKAAFLERTRANHNGILRPVDYWPNLCLIGCWKGGTVGHYIEQFPQWFTPDDGRQISVRDWGYLSTEAVCSIPVSDEGSAGILMVTANFYEFVPVEIVIAAPENPSSWTFLTTEQLEDGKEYYIFITTTGGLYRYNINDIIRVEGYYNKTPQIVFMRKGQGITNITGEKLSANQAIEAIEQAGKLTGFVPSYFKVEADCERSRYIVRVESLENISREKGKAFVKSFDEHLKNINIEYKSKRDSMRLHGPVLHVMCQGWYEHCQRQLFEDGKRVFQTKTLVLIPVKSQTKEIESELRQVIEI